MAVRKAAAKATAKKVTAKKVTAKNITAKKVTAKNITAKKAAAKKVTAKKATAKKATPKNITAKKATAKKATAPVTVDREWAQRSVAKRGRAADRLAWRGQMRGRVDITALSAAVARLTARAAPAPGQAHRWVPIGPSVVRHGQAAGAPRVVGRIRQVQADGTGRRAYAIGANGGVWYTDDGASTWSPVAPWAEFSRRRAAGGRDNAVSCGALLVTFDPGGAPAQDVVLVGTGEPLGAPFAGLLPNSPTSGGVGVLAKVPGGVAAVGPWEAETGGALLEGAVTYRLVRQPARTPGSVGTPPTPHPDRVAACTDMGLFIGTRQVVGGVGRYDWQLAATNWPGAIPANWPRAVVTDALWLPRAVDGSDDGRLVLAIYNWGLVFSDDAGATLQRVPTLDGPAVAGRVCMGALGTKGYVLGEAGGNPALWQIANLTADPSRGDRRRRHAGGVVDRQRLSQRDYDMALAVEAAPVGAGDDHDGVADGLVDRVFLGGSTIRVPTAATGPGRCTASTWTTPRACARRRASRRPGRRRARPTPGPEPTSLDWWEHDPRRHPRHLLLRGGTRSSGLGELSTGASSAPTTAGGSTASGRWARASRFSSPGSSRSTRAATSSSPRGCRTTASCCAPGTRRGRPRFLGDGGGVAFHPSQRRARCRSTCARTGAAATARSSTRGRSRPLGGQRADRRMSRERQRAVLQRRGHHRRPGRRQRPDRHRHGAHLAL